MTYVTPLLERNFVCSDIEQRVIYKMLKKIPKIDKFNLEREIL